MAEKDDLIVRRIGRLMRGEPVLPKHLQVAGACFILATGLLAGFNAHAWSNQELWPKALIMTPSVFLLGLWLVLDAKPLVEGTRQHQQAILWGCVLLGSAVGIAILFRLTGRVF